MKGCDKQTQVGRLTWQRGHSRIYGEQAEVGAQANGHQEGLGRATKWVPKVMVLNPIAYT